MSSRIWYPSKNRISTSNTVRCWKLKQHTIGLIMQFICSFTKSNQSLLQSVKDSSFQFKSKEDFRRRKLHCIQIKAIWPSHDEKKVTSQFFFHLHTVRIEGEISAPAPTEPRVHQIRFWPNPNIEDSRNVKISYHQNRLQRTSSGSILQW